MREKIDTFKIKKHKVVEEDLKNRLKGYPYEKIALALAKEKAESLMNEYPNDIIIGSDQVLVTSKGIINKPKNISQAKANLFFLSGKKHSLISSIYVIRNKNVLLCSRFTSTKLPF